LEREFGLRQVQERPQFGERAPTRAEDRMIRDRGVVSEKEQLKALIRDAAKDQPTMSEFVRRLEAQGVQVRANIAKTGHVSGISYCLDRIAVKGVAWAGRTASWVSRRSKASASIRRGTLKPWRAPREQPRGWSLSGPDAACRGSRRRCENLTGCRRCELRVRHSGSPATWSSHHGIQAGPR
jgi:hypothetical protein